MITALDYHMLPVSVVCLLLLCSVYNFKMINAIECIFLFLKSLSADSFYVWYFHSFLRFCRRFRNERLMFYKWIISKVEHWYGRQDTLWHINRCLMPVAVGIFSCYQRIYMIFYDLYGIKFRVMIHIYEYNEYHNPNVILWHGGWIMKFVCIYCPI